MVATLLATLLSLVTAFSAGASPAPGGAAAAELGHLEASQTPPWQAAAAIHDLCFQAQQQLYAWQRSDSGGAQLEEAAALLERADGLYRNSLQSETGRIAPAADEAITEALFDAAAAVEQGKPPALAAARGRLHGGLLWAAYSITLSSLETGDTEAAASWLRLREYRQSTNATSVEATAAEALASLRAGRLEWGEARPIIANDLRDAYNYRLRSALSQLDEAIESGFSTRAAEWAGLARGYFWILKDDFRAKHGDRAAAQLAGDLATLEEAVVADGWTEARQSLERIELALAQYQPVDLSTSQVAERGRLLHLFTDLVYTEYRDGVRAGEISIPIEYQEALTFRDQAEAIFVELQPIIAASDPAAAERLGRLLAEMESVMAQRGDRDRVEAQVGEALGIMEATPEIEPSTASPTAALTVIDTLLTDLLAASRQGRYEDAERTRLEAYAMFESGGPEQYLAQRAPDLMHRLEGLFWQGSGGTKGLAVLLDERAEGELVSVTVDQLRRGLTEAEEVMSNQPSRSLAVLNSAAIILREGLEAVLVIAAVLGFLGRGQSPGTARRNRARWIYAGVAAGLLFSLATWWAAQSLIQISAAKRELLEGITSLVAVAVLFAVTNWIFQAAYVVGWKDYIREQVDRATTAGSAFALATLGFIVVYREGFETVLFYQTLLFSAPSGAVLTGFVAGLAVLLLLAFVILRLSRRVPIAIFFTATSLILMVLAFNFTGSGVRALQVAGAVGTTLLPWVPESLLLMEGLGVFPTVETVVAQGGLLLLLAGTYLFSRRRRSSRPSPSPTTS